jgi:hypothetical protein
MCLNSTLLLHRRPRRTSRLMLRPERRAFDARERIQPALKSQPGFESTLARQRNGARGGAPDASALSSYAGQLKRARGGRTAATANGVPGEIERGW